MKSKIYFAAMLLSTLFIFNQQLNAQIPSWMWAKSVGGVNNDLCHSVAVDDSGNVYTTGTYEGTVDFNPGAGVFNMTSLGILDVYIMKLDSLGNFVWAKSFGGSGTESGYGISVDYAGNVFATGRYQNTIDFDPGAGIFNLTSNGYFDIFILRLNTNGDFVWAKSIGNTSDEEAFGLSLDGAGNLLLTGTFSNTVDFDPDNGVYNLTSNGGWDAFILKIENGGTFVWARSFGAALGDNGNAVAVDSLDNVYATGHFNGTVDFDPSPAFANINSNGGNDAFITKFDALGNFVWAKNLGGNQTDNGAGIYSDNNGNLYSTGHFQGTADMNPGTGVYNLISNGNSDVFVSKIDKTGNFGWADGFGSSASLVADYGYAIAADSKGNIYTTGIFTGMVDFNPGTGVSTLGSAGSNDAFILKLDTAGSFVWALKIGSQYSEQATCLAIDNTDHLYLAGHFMSYTLAFGAQTVTNALNGGTTADFFIAKLDFGVNTAAIQNNTIANSISVYPNPANDKLTVTLPAHNVKACTITMADVTGKIIYTTTSAMPSTTINTQNISSGFYLIQIQSGDFIETRKVIIGR